MERCSCVGVTLQVDIQKENSWRAGLVEKGLLEPAKAVSVTQPCPSRMQKEVLHSVHSL